MQLMTFKICQIACIGPDKSTYNAPITSITNLKVHVNVLLYNDQPVVTLSLKDLGLQIPGLSTYRLCLKENNYNFCTVGKRCSVT